MIFRLTRQILDMEIKLIKSNELSKAIEKRLLKKTELLESTRKELTVCRAELRKLRRNMNGPMVHSELLNVIS